MTNLRDSCSAGFFMAAATNFGKVWECLLTSVLQVR